MAATSSTPGFVPEEVQSFLDYVNSTAGKRDAAAFMLDVCEPGTKDTPVVISDEESVDADLAAAIELSKLEVSAPVEEPLAHSGVMPADEDTVKKFSDHNAFQAITNVAGLMVTHKVMLDAAIRAKRKPITALQYLFTKIMPGLGKEISRCFMREDGQRHVLYLKQASGKADIVYSMLHINRKKSDMCACYQADIGCFFWNLTDLKKEYGEGKTLSILLKAEKKSTAVKSE